MSNDLCTCHHYVVDFSDPERYHPENIDREDDPNCPQHGTTPRKAPMNQYYLCDENVDQRSSNQEHIYAYDAPDMATAIATHKANVGTEPVAIFNRAQTTVGFRQWG